MDHIKNFAADLVAGLNTDTTLYVLAACLNQLDKRGPYGAALKGDHVATDHAEIEYRPDGGWTVVYLTDGSADVAANDYGSADIPEGFAVQPLPQNWPPRAGDVWADRTGREWLCHGNDHGDARRYSFQDGAEAATVERLVEKAGPLRFVSGGWERIPGVPKVEVSA